MLSRNILVVGCATVLFSQQCFADPQKADARRIGDHVKILASDAFEGRMPGTAGEAKSTHYISRQFQAAGLSPGGEVKSGRQTWFQTVPVVEAVVTDPVQVNVRNGGGTTHWNNGEQIAVRASLVIEGPLTIADAPLVFIGYGVDAPERSWDDFKGVDLKGKIALFLSNDPDVESGSGDFGGKVTTAYARGDYKLEQAAKRGALGALSVHESAVAGFGWKTIANTFAQTRYDLDRPDMNRVHSPLEGSINREAAVELFRTAGLDFDALKKLAQTRAFRPVPLTGVTLSVRLTTALHRSSSQSVLGRLAGSTQTDESIIYAAHWDHEGTAAISKGRDRVYNGAVDNASGVAVMLEIARSLARHPKAARSIVFIAFTLEEPGLLGSEYYALHPLYPLSKTVAAIAMDGLFPMGRARDFTSHGYEDSELNDLLIEAGARQGRHYTPEPHPEMGLQMRTDHFPFAKRGVPAIFFAPGEDLVEGGTAAGSAYVRDYLTHRYHQLNDEFGRDWKLDGLAQDADLLVDLGFRLANSRQWPEWRVGAEFKAIRDATSAERH